MKTALQSIRRSAVLQISFDEEQICVQILIERKETEKYGFSKQTARINMNDNTILNGYDLVIKHDAIETKTRNSHQSYVLSKTDKIIFK